MIELRKVDFNSPDYKKGLEIRKTVFVDEQKVPLEDEVDEFEEESHHFLALMDGVPVGASRWRSKSDYVKLERFAVLKEFRGKGIGSALVEAVLEDILKYYPKGTRLLLHSQLEAIPLYSKFNFKIEGEIFEECGIKHKTMVRML